MSLKGFHKAAQQGEVEAQSLLGSCYCVAEGVSQNFTKAAKWFRKAAEQGDAYAQSWLAYCYSTGKGVRKNFTKAVKWCRKAAEQGDAHAQNRLGECYYLAEGVSQDYVEGAKWIHMAAEQGDAEAQDNLGRCYFHGQGVSQDYAEAVKWFRKAAKQGHAEAQKNLGWCYEDGKGVRKNLTKAAEWYRKAAEVSVQGMIAKISKADVVIITKTPPHIAVALKYDASEAPAPVVVAMGDDRMAEKIKETACEKNVPVRENKSLAHALYRKTKVRDMIPEELFQKVAAILAQIWKTRNRKAAEQGHAPPKNSEQIQKAAEQGDAAAQYNLGLMYDEGHGVPQDDSKAAEWYRKAAKQGCANAQYKLGNMYECGRGVPHDDRIAVKWFQKAAVQGHKGALHKVGTILFSPPPVQGNADIQPLTSAFMLREEGQAMCHCVGNGKYARAVHRGKCYIYRVLRPVRATLEIRPTGLGQRWKVHQIKGYRNAKIASDTIKMIRNWLRTHIFKIPEPAGQNHAVEKAYALLPLDTLELEIGYGLIPLVEEKQNGNLLNRIRSIRSQLAMDMGVILPPIHLRDNLGFEPGKYSLFIKGNEAASAEVQIDHFLVMVPGDAEISIEDIKGKEPAFNLPAVWITEEQKEEASSAGCTVVDPSTVIATHLTEVFRRNLAEFLGYQEVQELLDNLAKTAPKPVQELVPGILPLGVVQKVLQNLVRENVSIRDLQSIVETLTDMGVMLKQPEVLTEYVRERLARTIVKPYLDSNGALPIIAVDSSTEQELQDSMRETENGTPYMALAPETAKRLMQSINQLIETAVNTDGQPVVLATPVTRPHLAQLVMRFLPSVPVISQAEIPPDIRLTAVGIITAAAGDE